MLKPFLSLILALSLCHCDPLPKVRDEKLDNFLKEYNEGMLKISNLQTIASWNYNTDIKDETSEALEAVAEKVSS